MSRRALPLAALAALLAARAAAAHEVLHEIARDGAIAVRAHFPDGEPLAYAQFEIWSPADPRIPFQKGRTDRNGRVAFVPDAPGRWRVKVIDGTGHGVEVEVDAGAPGVAGGPSAAAVVLRPLAGAAAVGAAFALLWALQRRRRERGR